MKKIQFEEQGTKVVCPMDCDNAPKKRVLKEFITAMAVKNTPVIKGYIHENMYWDIVNEITVQGYEKVLEVIDSKMTSRILELDIQNIITHGKTAAANGTVKFEDNRLYSFCNVYMFVSAGKNTIKEMTSYIIKMN